MKDLYDETFDGDQGPTMAARAITGGLLYCVAVYAMLFAVMGWL